MLVSKLKQYKLPLCLVVIIVVVATCGDYIPLLYKQNLYGISLVLKQLLAFSLPFIVFSLIFGSLARLGQGALHLVLLLIPMICISNLISTWYAYFYGSNIISHLNFAAMKVGVMHDLSPSFMIDIPVLISIKHAMLCAVILGILCVVFTMRSLKNAATFCLDYTTLFLERLVIPSLPLMILGFIVKLQHDGVLSLILKNYSVIFIAILFAQVCYLCLYYLFAAKFNFQLMLHKMRTLLPAVVTGFSTMSSAAAMPMSLNAAKENTNCEDVSNFVVPTTVNFHLIGDSIAIPIFALAILKSFGYPMPDLHAYLAFSLYFVLAKFGVAAIPGGGILVMWPVLESHLGFNPEMLTFIQTLYVLFDPVITSINIWGNGGFAVIYNRVVKKFAQMQGAWFAKRKNTT